MGDFNRRFGRRGSRRDSGGRDPGRDRGSGPREMHEATCDECGSKCEVPFKPTEGKPVYCDNCFKTKGSGSRNNPGQSKELEQINIKLDKILKKLDID